MSEESCWLCRRTKEEIMVEIIRLENPPAEEINDRKKRLLEEITLEGAIDSDYPDVKYCTVCENILSDFAEKNRDEDDEEDEENGEEDNGNGA